MAAYVLVSETDITTAKGCWTALKSSAARNSNLSASEASEPTNMVPTMQRATRTFVRQAVALALLATLGLLASGAAQAAPRATSRCAPTHVRGTPFSIVVRRGRVSCGEAQRVVHTFQKGGGVEHTAGTTETWTVDGWDCLHGATATECFKGGPSYPRALEALEAFIQTRLPAAPIGSVLTVHERGDALQVSARLQDPVAAQYGPGQTPKEGYRALAVFLNLTNNSYGTISSDANGFTKIIGSDGLTYNFDPYVWLGSTAAQCGEFRFGEYSLLPESRESGCVVYLLPETVSVQAVQFGTYLEPEAQWNA